MHTLRTPPFTDYESIANQQPNLTPLAIKEEFMAFYPNYKAALCLLGAEMSEASDSPLMQYYYSDGKPCLLSGDLELSVDVWTGEGEVPITRPLHHIARPSKLGGNYEDIFSVKLDSPTTRNRENVLSIPVSEEYRTRGLSGSVGANIRYNIISRNVLAFTLARVLVSLEPKT